MTSQDFRGRASDLRVLTEQLDALRSARPGPGGRAIMVTGRRRVGKSRLAQEFCDRSDVSYLVFQATKGRNPRAERGDFIDAIAQSTLANRELVAGMQPNDWNQALRSLAMAVSDASPSVIVLDEIPWLAEQDEEFEGALQTVWDRQLSSKPIMLILVGSDLSVMESLRQYGRPFFGRATRMSVKPLHVGDVQLMTGLNSADSFDALLITGGFPEIVKSWQPGMTRNDFLRDSLHNPLSPLLAAGELSMLGEFPQANHARSVLEVIGTGERTFSAIANKTGAKEPMPSSILSPILTNLQSRNVISADLPLSTRQDNKNKRYRLADFYLRFWLALLRPGIPEVERGRGDLALRRIDQLWTSWRGRAIEPIIRAALARLLPDENWPETAAIGGWWNRQNNPEIDLIGADRDPVAQHIHFVGSIKWLENKTFGQREYDTLLKDSAHVPGISPETRMVAVSRTGIDSEVPLAQWWGPEELVTAWQKS